MTKKRPTIRLNARSLADQRVKLVYERKPDDTIRANGSDAVGTGHDMRGRGLRPIGEAVFRVVSGIRRGHHVKPTTGEET